MPHQQANKLTKTHNYNNNNNIINNNNNNHIDIKQLRQCVLKIAQSNNYVINNLLLENQTLKTNNVKLEGRVEVLERVSKELQGAVDTLRENVAKTQKIVESVDMSKYMKRTEVMIVRLIA